MRYLLIALLILCVPSLAAAQTPEPPTATLELPTATATLTSTLEPPTATPEPPTATATAIATVAAGQATQAMQAVADSLQEEMSLEGVLWPFAGAIIVFLFVFWIIQTIRKAGG